MNVRNRLVAGAGLAALGLLAMPGVSLADVTKAQCVTANSAAQDFRRNGKLSEARQQLQVCGDATCPDIVRADCTKRLDELETAQPTIVFDAKDGKGGDLTVVKVSVDNKPLVDTLDGSALRVNPGEHTFTFEVAGEAPVTSHLVLKEGEKERHEKIVIGAAATVDSAGEGARPGGDIGTVPAPRASSRSSQKWIGVGLAAAGVAGLAVGGVFGVLTGSAINQQKTDCASATRCNYTAASADHSTWSKDGTISTVAFIAGGVLLASGAVVFFTAPSSTESAALAAAKGRPPAPTLVAVPAAGLRGGGFLVQGSF